MHQQQQQQEWEDYSCAGYTTLESPSASGNTWSEAEDCGKMKQKEEGDEGIIKVEADRGQRNSCQWTSHRGI